MQNKHHSGYTFEELMKKYGDDMSPNLKAKLYINRLNSCVGNKQRAEQQLKNIAPFLAGNGVIKNSEEQKPKRKKGWTPTRIVDSYFRYREGDYVIMNESVNQIIDLAYSVDMGGGRVHNARYELNNGKFVGELSVGRKATPQEIKEYTAPYKAGDYVKLSDKMAGKHKHAIVKIRKKTLRPDLCYAYEFEGIDYGYALDSIERQATVQEFRLYEFPYKVGDYVTTGFNNRVQQIKELSVLSNVTVKLDNEWGFLPSSVINRKASDAEIVIATAKYKVGNFIKFRTHILEINHVYLSKRGDIWYSFADYDVREKFIDRLATKGEILQHQHGLIKGDFVLAWHDTWTVRKQFGYFSRFTDDGEYIEVMSSGGIVTRYSCFCKLDDDIDKEKIEL